MKTNIKPTTKHKEMGIFYTDKAIVDFIYSIIDIWKDDEDKNESRWLRHSPKPKYPSVIDPAVGEGVFLKEALERSFTDKHHIFGIDLDEGAVERWKQIHLLKAFGGNEKDLEAHFFHQNGLDNIQWQQHISKYKYQLRQDDIKNQQFDLVIGNPPFGGSGIDMKTAPDSLLESLWSFEVLPEDVRENLVTKQQSQISLLESESDKVVKTHEKVSKRLSSFPIEILFVEKFIKLAKPGGWVAIILPEGIFANSNAHNVREFITRHAKIEAIVSLPRDAFKNVGTNAKTNILFLRKYGRKTEEQQNYDVFLASVSKTTAEIFNNITKQYFEYYGGNMVNPVQIIKDQDGKEQGIVRIDKNIQDLMSEKPFSRWEVKYWHPKYDTMVTSLRRLSKDVQLRTYVSTLTSGYRGSINFSKTGLPAIKVRNVMDVGIDISDTDYLDENSPAVTELKKVHKGDIIINRSGSGSIGRMAVYTQEKPAVITGDVYLLRVKNISPEYVTVFLKSELGQQQIQRFETGVSGQTKVDLDDILSIYLPHIEELERLIVNNFAQIDSNFQEAQLHDRKSSKYTSAIKKAEEILNETVLSLNNYFLTTENRD